VYIYDYNIWSRIINTRKTVLSPGLIITLREWQQANVSSLTRKKKSGKPWEFTLMLDLYKKVSKIELFSNRTSNVVSSGQSVFYCTSVFFFEVTFPRVCHLFIAGRTKWNSRKWKKIQKTSKPTAGVRSWFLKCVRY
jgi:hypothetical protein